MPYLPCLLDHLPIASTLRKVQLGTLTHLGSLFETRLQIHPAMIAQMVKRLSLKMAPPCEVSCCSAFVANDLAYCYVFPVENI